MFHISQEAEVYSVSSGLWRAFGIKWEKKKKKNLREPESLWNHQVEVKEKIKEERMKE